MRNAREYSTLSPEAVRPGCPQAPFEDSGGPPAARPNPASGDVANAALRRGGRYPDGRSACQMDEPISHPGTPLIPAHVDDVRTA